MQRKTAVVNGVLCAALLGVGFGGYSVLSDDANASSTTRTISTVQRGSVQTSVTATGNLVAVTQVDASFDTAVASNLVAEILVKVGDRVTKGQPLAKLDDRTVQTALVVAKASFANTQANYDKVVTGLTAEDRALLDIGEAQSRASIANAEASLENAVHTVELNVVSTAEAVRQADLNLVNAQAQAERDLLAAQTAFDTAKTNYDPAKAARDSAAVTRDAALRSYEAAQALVDALIIDQQWCTDNAATVAPSGRVCGDIPAASVVATADRNAKLAVSNDAQAATTKAEALLVPLTTAYNNALTNLDNAKLKTKQSVDSATTSAVNARSNQTNGAFKDEQSVASAQRSLDSARLSYQSLLNTNSTKRKGPTEADLASQELALINGKNSLATAERNAANTVLTASASGTVAVINGRVSFAGNNTTGGTTGTGAAGSSTPFMTITDTSSFEVKAGFSEADAAKVRIGQTVVVTVDAANGARLGASVRSIDTASTLVNNVVTYYAYLSITTVPSGVVIVPGMTASAAVGVQKVDNVLYLPTAAVPSRGTTAAVTVQPDKTKPKVTESRQITLGLRGDTTIEIIDGVLEGELVITERAAVNTAQVAQNSTGQIGGATPGAGAVVPAAGAAGAGGFTGAGAAGGRVAPGGSR